MPSSEWQKVFKLAVKKAKECRAKTPSKPYTECMKAAWKDPEVKRAVEAYRKSHPEAGKKKKAAKKK